MKRPLIPACLLLLALATSSASFGKEADCSVARDPRRCEALQAAREACAGLQGQARGTCIRDAVPPPDCSRAPNSAECQARQAAREACRDQHGKIQRRCLREKMRNLSPKATSPASGRSRA